MQQALAATVVASVVAAFVVVAVFLVVRFFWLWYWRVNEIVGLLGAIREELHALNARERAPSTQQPRSTPPIMAPAPLPPMAVPPSPQRTARPES